ncbi:MAG: putative transposase YdaD [Phenylobacterium sp.]|jgi:predicted transposase YdaD
MLSVGKIADREQFMKDVQQLPEQVRGEIMTAAEEFQAIGEVKGLEKGLKKGREEGREEGQEKTAINLLKEGSDPQFVARITELELAVILKLQAQRERS